MRKTLFSLALAMAVLSSCSSDDIVNNPDVDYDYFYDFLTNYEENVYAKVEANAAQ